MCEQNYDGRSVIKFLNHMFDESGCLLSPAAEQGADSAGWHPTRGIGRRRWQIRPPAFLRLPVLAQRLEHRREQSALAGRSACPSLRLVECVFARERNPSRAQPGVRITCRERQAGRPRTLISNRAKLRSQVNGHDDVGHAASSMLRRSARDRPSSSGPVRSISTFRLVNGSLGSQGCRSSSVMRPR